MTSYSAFLVELTRLLTGDELSPTDLPIATLQQIVGLAENRIARDVRSVYNEQAFSAAAVPPVVTNNLAPLPADFQASSIVHLGKFALLPKPEAFVIEFNQCRQTGDTLYFAVAGNNFTFAPPASDTTELQGRYYFRQPPLDSVTAPTNSLFNNEYDIYLYASLAEGAPIFNKLAELPAWEAKYGLVLSQVNQRFQNAAFSAGRARVSPSTRLMR